MDLETKIVLAGLAAITVPAAVGLLVLFVRKRRSAGARFYFSLRSTERTSTSQHSKEPPPFPDQDDDHGS